MSTASTTVYQRVRRWLRPVRTRLTLLATGLVTVALAIAATVMVGVLHQVLLRSADASTSTRAEQIADEIMHDGPSRVDPDLLTTGQNISVIQVIDKTGRIRFANQPQYDRALSAPVLPGRRATVHGAHAMRGSDDEFRTTVLGVESPQGTFSVAVAAAEEPLNRTAVIVAILCCIAFPLIVIGIAFLTHHFVGRALRPVDDMRKRVDAISGGDIDQRVPVPETDDEIATLATTMNEMLDRIETARTQQLRFVNDASHELNSPLTTLVGLLDLARATDEPIDTETVNSVMLPDALRLQQMVADLLLLARSDESGVPLTTRIVDLDELVSAEIARLEAITDLTVHAEIVAVRINGDGEKLGRALRNIADNAVRHTRDSLTVSLTHDAVARTATITVSDNGTGIPDADKGRVTDRFVRLDTARARTRGGSGLGLAIVSEIVRAHHGTVIVTDSSAGGAMVGFALPTT
ncbi:sensor histidine kinase [Gordonia zhaorongruii]|uniref:sensor histidine kinase n=1 Tax=Gordonia zhaorongruii TaxID=2597659 RepID=UPI001F15F90B|nr:ATP-binding protein [Gordonia zhaorongruii]